MEKKVAATIITFNPDMIRLKKNIEFALKQFSYIQIVDNNSQNSNEINNLCKDSKCLKYVQLDKNMGLAFALNKAFSLLKKNGYHWVMSLDQDSILQEDTIENYLKVIDENEKIAIVSPTVIDVRRKYMNYNIMDDYIEVEKCITSGCLTNLSIWEKIGKFDERLFIDLIDNDFCKRVRINNYKIIRCCNIILNQEFGSISPRSKIIEKFFLKLGNIFKNDNLSKLSYKKYVDPLRIYYTNRNVLYLNKKFQKFGGIGYESYSCKSYIGFFFVISVSSFIRGKKKMKILESVIRGIADGKALAKDTAPYEIEI
jgi:GT2 family glycosyltransferase